MFPNRVTAAPCERCSEANLPLVSSMPVAVVGLSELRERQNVPDGLRRPPTASDHDWAFGGRRFISGEALFPWGCRASSIMPTNKCPSPKFRVPSRCVPSTVCVQ